MQFSNKVFSSLFAIREIVERELARLEEEENQNCLQFSLKSNSNFQ
jgi:hypothetical protein